MTGPAVIELAALDGLLVALRRRGFTVIGPTRRDDSIVFDELSCAADLPAGCEDVQDGGSLRLRRRDDDAVFAHTVGHDSLKRFLFPPAVRTWRARRAPDERAHGAGRSGGGRIAAIADDRRARARRACRSSSASIRGQLPWTNDTR